MDEDFSPMLYKNLNSFKDEVNFSSGIPISFFESHKVFQFFIQTILTTNTNDTMTQITLTININNKQINLTLNISLIKK